MLIGIVTDIHDAVRPSRATLTALRQSGVEQVVTLALAGVLGFAHAAHAELTILTPEVARKIHALAEAAREAHLTSPNAAALAFNISFNGTFSDVTPVDLHIVNTPALSVVMGTPLMHARTVLFSALQQLLDLPSTDDLLQLNAVVVTVEPRQHDAPNVSRVMLFRGDQQIEPRSSDLAPQLYRNAFGAEFQLNAGVVTFPPEALQPGPELRVLLLTSGVPIEWRLPASDVARIR